MKVSRRNLSLSVMALALVWVGEGAWAQAYSAFSTDTIYGSLKHEEAVSFNKAAVGVLENTQDNATTLWSSPTKRRTPITATLNADGVQQQNGMPCRLLHSRLERGPNHESWEFLFCQKDGQWKAVSQTLR
ncbi:hypothetical protein CAL20_11120 [Bordetella genomosp. 4]|uniref:Surface antigen domain-containing protein n=2 Tax=Bordetella genomosp. 4 TaxID=463044 RepID=A0A261U294_9BORD|nr:hypothetical protein CAL20_11120 [Bordetella genomosp. 4]